MRSSATHVDNVAQALTRCRAEPVLSVADTALWFGAQHRGRCKTEISKSLYALNLSRSVGYRHPQSTLLQRNSFFQGGRLQLAASDAIQKRGLDAGRGRIRSVLDTAVDSDDEASSYDAIVRKQVRLWWKAHLAVC